MSERGVRGEGMERMARGVWFLFAFQGDFSIFGGNLVINDL